MVRRYSIEYNIYNPTQVHDVIVIEWHWLLDYCVLHLYVLLYLSIARSLMKKWANFVISIKCYFPNIAKISTQQEKPVL